MSINSILFTLFPGIALLCNIFLLMTLLTARKNKTINSFMLLLGSFILWSCGSLLLRLQFFPSANFWNLICLDGMLLVPWFYYLLAIHYLNIRGFLLKVLWGVCTVGMLIMNHMNLFLSTPVITTANNTFSMRYDVHLLLIVPVVLSIVIFASIWRVVLTALRQQGTPSTHFTPLLIGVGILVLGTVLPTSMPFLNSLPIDSLACAANACCIYYALCKKRLFALNRQIVSKAPTYFMTVVVSSIVLLIFFPLVQSFFKLYLPSQQQHETVIIAILFSTLGILLSHVLSELLNNVFVRDKIEREDRLRAFSESVSRTLHLDEVIDIFRELLHSTIPGEGIYICLYSPESNTYQSTEGSAPIRRNISLRGDHPLILWLSKYNTGMLYTEFIHTSLYKSLWEEEKRLLQDLNIGYLMPVRCDDKMIGITLLPEKSDHKSYTFDETVFLDSAVSVVSIAMQNASLYETIRSEAQRDSLTGLYNRRFINEQLAREFQRGRGQMISLILFNLDNFRLYNELHGSGEGDAMLQRFAALLTTVIGSHGTIARYGGKEFVAVLPFCDGAAALDYSRRVETNLREYVKQSGEKVNKFLTFSAGICTYPTAAGTPGELLSYANLAVFSAKQHGKNRIIVYSRSAGGMPPVRDKADIVLEYSSTIYALTAAIDAKDHYTFSHSQYVSEYAAELAKAYGLDNEHIEIIRQAGLLHDIGKIGIPDAILSKTGRLNDDEVKIMQQHVELSIEMIRHLPSLNYVIPAVLGHHERYDGRGYPRGIAGDSIPVGARCLCIVDAFDAMISRRPYKEPMPIADALNEIRRSLGRQFDPELGALFIKLVQDGVIPIHNI